ncbi:MAG: 4Fe-4S dicluster domain-containing protein [Bacteroidota bacterium]
MDCGLCTKVCPTGIDIRNGTQLECINCTACMDVCDGVMEKIGREKGLIRYDSYNGITTGRKRIFTPRVIAYTAVLAALLIFEGFLLSSRTAVEVLLLRTPGMLYQEVDEQTLSNLYNYQIINKTNEDLPIEFMLEGEGIIKLVGQAPIAKATEVTEGALFIEIPKSALESRKTKVKVRIISDGKELNTIKTNFLGIVK